MNAVARYWMLVRLDTRGKITVEEITAAKTFMDMTILSSQIPSDTQIQRHLVNLCTNPTHGSIAQTCLRCYISSQIQQVCIDFERRFGQHHGFDRSDLFPFVLDDTLAHLKPPKPTSNYTPMAMKVLQTFDPQRASLSTWTSRSVTSDHDLNAFLLSRGLYLVSDWAILNDTPPRRLQHILGLFHHLNAEPIAQAQHLLESYHAIYRQDRLTAKKTGMRGKCQRRSDEQLQRMAIHLNRSSLSSEQILVQLQNLADYLRKYRIYAKGGRIHEESLDQPETQHKIEQQQIGNSDLDDEPGKEFIRHYRQQFLGCLEQAIAHVIQRWTTQQKNDRKRLFLQGLELFHCQGYSMGEIAPLVGLRAQYQVTRLLKLKDFRSDIRRQMLQHLPQQILVMAASYTNPDRLLEQEKSIATALDEQVATVIQEAESEASLTKNRPLKSLFARTLCSYLKENI